MRLLGICSAIIFALTLTVAMILHPPRMDRDQTSKLVCVGDGCQFAQKDESGLLKVRQSPWVKEGVTVNSPTGSYVLAITHKPLAILEKSSGERWVISADGTLIKSLSLDENYNLPWIKLCGECTWENTHIQETSLKVLQKLNEPQSSILSELIWESFSHVVLLTNSNRWGAKRSFAVGIDREVLDLETLEQQISSINQVLKLRGVEARRIDMAPGKKFVVKTRTDS